MVDKNSLDKIKMELERAYQSQAEGKEGRARVCARRAAGWAIEAVLEEEDRVLESSNAYKHIQYYASIPGHDQKVYQVLHHLTVRLAKDSFEDDAYYPITDVDLVTEAHWLVEELMQTSIPIKKQR
jgi:hypothetical protein